METIQVNPVFGVGDYDFESHEWTAVIEEQQMDIVGRLRITNLADMFTFIIEIRKLKQQLNGLLIMNCR